MSGRTQFWAAIYAPGPAGTSGGIVTSIITHDASLAIAMGAISAVATIAAVYVVIKATFAVDLAKARLLRSDGLLHRKWFKRATAAPWWWQWSAGAAKEMRNAATKARPALRDYHVTVRQRDVPAASLSDNQVPGSAVRAVPKHANSGLRHRWSKTTMAPD
jgi:hypothetical protein